MKQGLTLYEEQFCQYVALGKTAREAYSLAYSVAITDSKRRGNIDNRASRLMKRADIVSRIAEAAGEAKRRNRQKWEERGEDLADLVYNGILAAQEEGKILSAGALKGVEVLAKLKGLNAPEETILKDGGKADEAFVPRGLEGMSEEDLRAIIAAEEKTITVDASDASDAPEASVGSNGGDDA